MNSYGKSLFFSLSFVNNFFIHKDDKLIKLEKGFDYNTI
ncbi:hypothetical protein LACWKB8_0026 [Lactobacillus sp. wkB8]|nr:hypothetical protein LACWKB8_0026 [Lactobacillus sp. wkB8]